MQPTKSAEDHPAPPVQIDFGALFAAVPSPLLVVAPDAPHFTIIGVNEAYLAATMRTRAELVGRGIFEAFPDNPEEVDASGVANLRASLERALASRRPDTMPVQKYDIPLAGGGFEERWWDPVNTPVLAADGSVAALVHQVIDATSRIRAEAAHIESERELRRITDALPVLVSYIDQEERYRFVNKTYETWFGHSRDEMHGRHMRDVLGDAAYQELKPAIQRALSGERMFFDSRLPYKDGGTRDVHVEYVPCVEADGQIHGFYVMVQDIGDRVRAEAALRESEARLRFLSELDEALRSAHDAPQAMQAAATLLGTHLGVSRCAYADLDSDNDRFIIRSDFTAAGIASSAGTYSLDLFGPRAAADMRQGRTLIVRDVPRELAPGEGREMFGAIGVDAIICCPLVRNGRLVAMMAVHQDRPREWQPDEIERVQAVVERCWAYVERVGAEARLRASEERYRQIVEGADDFAIVALDEAGIITSWNSGAERLLGFSEQEAVGQSGALFFTPEDREAGAPEHELTRTESSGRAVNERWHMRKDGSRFWGSGLMMDVAGGGFLKMFRDRTAEHEAEARVRDSEAQLIGVLDSMAEGFVLLDREFRIQRINAEGLRIEGSPESALVGRSHWEVWPGSEDAPQGQLYKRLMREGGSGDVEVHYTWPDREAWFDARAYSTPQGLAIFFRDITDRKRVEAAFKEKAFEFEALAENVSQLAWMAEPDGHIYWYNKRWFEFTGATLKELLGWGWQKFPHPDHVEHVTAEWNRSIAKGVPYEGTFPMRRADGEYRWFLTRAEPIRDADGRIVRWFGTNTDITAERDAEERYRTLFTSIDAGFCVVELIFDQDGRPVDYRFVETNPAFARQTGLENAVGKSMRELAPSHEQHWFDIYGQVALSGEAIRFEQEAKALARWYDVYAFRVGRPEDRRVAILFNDISARRNAEERLRELNDTLEQRVLERTAELETVHEQLRQSQKMEAMGQLMGGVAHDFNNLLTPIVGALDMLQRRSVGGEREQRLIGGAVQSADRAKTLVQRLLAFARRSPLQPTAVDIAALTRGMAELVSSTTGPQIKVVLDAPEGLPAATADPNQLEMAILNLAVNARDAMPEGGTLRISASAEAVGRDHPKLRPGRYVRLSVADTGIGMDEATLARAVEPFFSTKGIGKGTGLGLSMVHGLASQLGGALLIHSQPGIGTNIEFWLHASADAAEPADVAETVQLTGKGKGTALIVDDEQFVRASTADMLIDLGHDVVEADSAEAALRLIGEGLRPDLLLTDHLMPGMSGTDLAREVRARLPGTVVLVVSGYAEAEDVAPDLPRLTKPFGSAQLAAAVAEAIERHRH